MNKNNKIKKIILPTKEDGIESQIDSRFGRCNYFLLAEIKNGKITNVKSIENEGAKQGSGAGIAAVEQIIGLGANVLIAEDVGPKAKSMLEQLGIKIIKDSGSAKDVLGRYIK